MDKNHLLIIIIGIFILFIIVSKIKENFPYGNYVRTTTMGRTLPRVRDRDNIIYNANGESNETENEDKYLNENDEQNNLANQNDLIQKIETENPTQYIWDGSYNFPYGGYYYDKSYPVYLAKEICPPEKPFYSTLDGKCTNITLTDGPLSTIT